MEALIFETDFCSTYNEGLKYYPRNGWTLNGLRQAYEALNQPEKAKEADEKFKEAWKYADVKLAVSEVQ